jgi:hypothetical protein
LLRAVSAGLAVLMVERETGRMLPLKVVRYGEKVGVVIPPELLAPLKPGAEDVLEIVQTREGPVLVASSPETARQLRVAREVMKRRADVLETLAKS